MFAQLSKYSAVEKGLISFCYEGQSIMFAGVATNGVIDIAILYTTRAGVIGGRLHSFRFSVGAPFLALKRFRSPSTRRRTGR